MGNTKKANKGTNKATDKAPDKAPELSPEQVEEKATMLKALREQVAQLEGELAGYRSHMLVTSTVKGPVALFRDIFLSYVGEDNTPGKRGDVIRRGVQAGIAPNTCKTQFQVNKGRLSRGELDGELEALRATVEGK